MPEPDVLGLGDLPPDDPDFQPCGVPEDEQTEPGFLGQESPGALTHLVAHLAKWRVNYRLVEGYAARGRPTGGFAPRAVQWHHTGSTSSPSNPHPSLGTLTLGRSDLPGPLCQLSPDYEGTVWVVALGRANHAGTARAHGALPAGDGNALRIALEVQTSGLQRIPQAQFDATILATVAVLDMLGVAPGEVAGYVCRHYDTSVTGKWDIGAGDGGVHPMDIRPHIRAIAALLAAGPTPTKDWFDMATTADLSAVVEAAIRDPEYLRLVARYVLTGYAYAGADGVDSVLAAHLRRLEAAVAAPPPVTR